MDVQDFSKISHSENAIAIGFWRWPSGGGQCQPEDSTGVQGIDHAIVPEAGGGVPWVSLGVVLLADGGFEGFLIVRGPLLAARCQDVPTHSGQDAGRLFSTHD